VFLITVRRVLAILVSFITRITFTLFTSLLRDAIFMPVLTIRVVYLFSEMVRDVAFVHIR
jgi:hypothetical protein